MKLKFNTFDPSYLNKDAPSNKADAKYRLSKLPESVKDSLLRIDDYLQRKGIDSKRCFRDMDKNKDGTISKEEFQKVLIREYRIKNFTIEQLGEVYSKLDQNNSNSLTIGEFMYYIEGAHQSVEDRKKQMSDDVKEQMLYEINRLWDELDEGQKSFIVLQYDPDKDGKLSKKEFQDIMLEKMTNELIEDEDAVYDMNTMFHNADINKDGYLSIDELYIMFKQFDVNVTYDEIVSFMREIDVDKDGRLDIDEFIALMTMDMSSFKNSKSVNTGMKIKRAGKIPAADIARYFKMMPKHFIDSFTTKQWRKCKNLPSSAFKPKINPETLLYEDLKSNIRPKSDKDYPLLAFQLLLDDATGVPVPPKELNDKGGEFKIIKRELRLCMYNFKTKKFIANSSCARATVNSSSLDKWIFNSWSTVGQNPFIFSCNDENFVNDDDCAIIFEFVIFCKMGDIFKDVSCGFSTLSMKEFKDKNSRKTTFTIEIKGGSPDSPIQIDSSGANQNLSFFKKISRGNIIPRLKFKIRYLNSFSDEGKFNIAMLPKICIINKKLLHFFSGYRNYLAQKLCKETTENAGFVMPSANHVISAFPFIVDNPDVCEKFLIEWHNNVSKKIPKSSKKNVQYLIDKVEIYISRMYLIKYSDKFGLVEGREYESVSGEEEKMKAREDLISYALKTDMPGISYKPPVKLEAMTTFKPFNIRELEVDFFDNREARIEYYQEELEKRGLKKKSSSKQIPRVNN